MKLLTVCLAATLACSIAVVAQPRQPHAILYEGARLITGDGGAPIENGALLVRDGRIVEAGSSVDARTNARRVDLAGKTIMPAMINVHAHIGYEGYTSWGAPNYTAPNVLDHLQREAFYGIAATVSVGSSPTDPSIRFQQDQAAGRFAAASRFLFVPGMAPPNGGPDAVLLRGTAALKAVYEVSTADAAREAVRSMAGKNIRHVKIWVDDRRGTYPKMAPEVYHGIIDEAHRHRMLVHAHALTLADQKAVVRAGVDVLVHTVGGERVDEEFLSLLREKQPYWTTVIGLGDRTEICDNDPFVDQTLPVRTVADIRATTVARGLTANCAPRPATASAREETLAHNVSRMHAAGARLVLGTDAGIHPGYTFGSSEHHEIARWVQFGLTPNQAIVAATSRPAALMGLDDLGTLAAGKSADFVVLSANPLENIRNTRRIAAVYLRGVRVEREALLARWRR